jgi:hypothetical protein
MDERLDYQVDPFRNFTIEEMRNVSRDKLDLVERIKSYQSNKLSATNIGFKPDCLLKIVVFLS